MFPEAHEKFLKPLNTKKETILFHLTTRNLLLKKMKLSYPQQKLGLFGKGVFPNCYLEKT